MNRINKQNMREGIDIEQSNKEMSQWENESAVEIWNAFVEITEALSGFEDAGCDIYRCYKALSTIMNTKEPVNRRLIAEWLGAGRFEYKGLNDIK